MPKHITLSRRKQSAPLDLDAFKEKRSAREQAKKASKAAVSKPIDVDEEVAVDKAPVNDMVKKRKNEKKDSSSKKGMLGVGCVWCAVYESAILLLTRHQTQLAPPKCLTMTEN